jgi:hypothetical protein
MLEFNHFRNVRVSAHEDDNTDEVRFTIVLGLAVSQHRSKSVLVADKELNANMLTGEMLTALWRNIRLTAGR